jgi:hypothetical protein
LESEGASSAMVKKLTLLIFALLSGYAADAAELRGARVIKVLPHFLDQDGRHSLYPSLYERDAYQAFLRAHPAQQSGIRFDVQWKARGASAGNLTLRLELRFLGSDEGKPRVLEKVVKPSRWFSRWSALTLDGEEFKGLGRMTAWRAVLLDEGVVLTELKSFLW